MTRRLRVLGLSALISGTLVVLGCNKPEESSVTPPKTTVGTEIDDSVVTARVKSALMADANIKSFDIKVETRKGEVQLSGFVDNQAQIDQAISVARSTEADSPVRNA